MAEYAQIVTKSKKLIDEFVGLHYQGKEDNNTDFVQFLNGAKWNDDVVATEHSRIVQWPAGEIFDETSENTTLNGKDDELMLARESYGIWHSTGAIGKFTDLDGEEVEIYIGQDFDGNKIELGNVYGIKIRHSNSSTEQITMEGLISDQLVQKLSNLAKYLRNSIFEGNEQYANSSPEQGTVVVQEIALGFNTNADASSVYILEAEKAGPHLAIGNLGSHDDFLIHPDRIDVYGLRPKQTNATPTQINTWLNDREHIDTHFDQIKIYSDGKFIFN